MIETIRSEYLKLRTTRTAGGLFAGMLALTGLAIWGSVANASPGKLASGLSSTEVLVPVLVVIPVFVLILGIRSFTDEFRHGSVVPTFLATPDRRRVLAAKAVVIAAASAGAALVTLVFGAGLAMAFLAVEGVTVPIAWGAIATLTGKMLVLTVIWSSLGVAIGALVRHQVAAIAGSLAWLLIGEGIVTAIVPASARWLPGQAGGIALGLVEGTSAIVGWVGLVMWASVTSALATVTLIRRDVV
jgi:ABC-type transport system involved in multi-copper enzyme maturation permease subunit